MRKGVVLALIIMIISTACSPFSRLDATVSTEIARLEKPNPAVRTEEKSNMDDAFFSASNLVIENLGKCSTTSKTLGGLFFHNNDELCLIGGTEVSDGNHA